MNGIKALHITRGERVWGNNNTSSSAALILMFYFVIATLLIRSALAYAHCNTRCNYICFLSKGAAAYARVSQLIAVPRVLVRARGCVFKIHRRLRLEPIPDGAVSCPWASQVFLFKWCPKDRHIPSRFYLANHAINQHNIATLPLISAHRVSKRHRQCGRDSQRETDTMT